MNIETIDSELMDRLNAVLTPYQDNITISVWAGQLPATDLRVGGGL